MNFLMIILSIATVTFSTLIPILPHCCHISMLQLIIMGRNKALVLFVLACPCILEQFYTHGGTWQAKGK
jgi:hypothetical protein